MNLARTFAFAFATLVVLGLAVAGCGGAGGSGPAPVALSSPPLPTPTPPANKLYVDHNGVLYQYALPIKSGSKPVKTLVEAPGSQGVAPQIAVDAYGTIAIVTTSTLRLFHPPIVSFSPTRAKLSIPLTPAMTQIGPNGAVLADVEYDPNQNLWLLSTLGEVSELRAPLSQSTQTAAITVIFGAPGSKTAGYFPVRGSFDINAALYVFAGGSGSQLQDRMFKLSFPYAKPPSGTGLNLEYANFIDSSQYLPTDPNPAPLILGQYYGSLKSPPPGSPPPPPVYRLSQFAVPLNPVQGLFPNATVNQIVGAIAADPPRNVFYALDQPTGKLFEYSLPLKPNAKPNFTLPCLGGDTLCSNKNQHLFLAP
jgi:hypothetical protein